MKTFGMILLCALLIVPATGCNRSKSKKGAKSPVAKQEAAPLYEIVQVAHSEQQWTGVAVSRDGRIFVCYPRWSDYVPMSVGEVVSETEVVPYPDKNLNAWNLTGSVRDQFVCVQSLYIDSNNNLWILDAGNPKFEKLIDGAPKLMRVDVQTNKVVHTYRFEPGVLGPNCYLNDVRVDNEKEVAYLTDSGEGAIFVLDLRTGETRKLLGDHSSTKSEGAKVRVQGHEWRRNGDRPQVHADGLALTPRGDWLYYQALTARTLYRIPTSALLDRTLSSEAVEAQVEKVREGSAVDGMIFSDDGFLYLTNIEASAINRLTPGGTVQNVAQDSRMKWPDSFSIDDLGHIYVTTSQVHLGEKRTEPYRLFRIRNIP